MTNQDFSQLNAGCLVTYYDAGEGLFLFTCWNRDHTSCGTHSVDAAGLARNIAALEATGYSVKSLKELGRSSSRPVYRIQWMYGDRWTFERFDGSATGNQLLWRVVETCDNREYAEDRLAVAEGRMTKQEAGKRVLARQKATGTFRPHYPPYFFDL